MIGRAAEIMTSRVISIKSEDTLDTAIKLLEEHKISGLPVVDENNKLIGILSERDIIDYSGKLQVVPRTASSGWVSPYTDVSNLATIKKGYETMAKTEVKDIMKKRVVSVQADTSGDGVIDLMRKKNVNRIPVVDKNGALIGIITRSDIINHFAANA